MALNSALGITGILFVVIGIIMAIVGIILLIVNTEQMKPWYIWFLLVGGVVIGILGGIMLAIALSSPPPMMMTTVPRQVEMKPMYVAQQPMMVTAPQPQQVLQLKAKQTPPPAVNVTTVPVSASYDPYAQTNVVFDQSTQRNVPAQVDFGGGVVQQHVGDYTKVNKKYIQQDYPQFEVEEQGVAPTPAMPYYAQQQAYPQQQVSYNQLISQQ